MKKVLIITYYWPPFGGSGVQRWLKFVKYLQDYNWKPIIYTPKNPYIEIFDKDLLDDIPKDINIWKTNIWEPYKIKDFLFGNQNDNQSSGIVNNRNLKDKFLNWIRGNIFIPDPKKYWVSPSIKYLKKKIKNNNINHIITTGPPHSMHLIGLGLKSIMPKIKWIADFRDPWSDIDLLDSFHLSNYAQNKNQKLEIEVLKKSNAIIAVSETWRDNLILKGANHVELITNGYDESDFKNCKLITSDKFIIGHYGLLNKIRNPKLLWKILNELCEENVKFNSNLEIRLSGNIDNNIITSIKSFPFLKDKLVHLGNLTHKQVIKEYFSTSVLLLLLFNSQSGKGNYPGKLFEYFATKNPILAFGPKQSDVKNLLKLTNKGLYFNYENEKNIKEGIINLFENKIKFAQKSMLNFTRKELTMKLSDLLNKI